MPLTATLWVSRLYYFTNNTTHKMKTPLLLVSILCGMALTSIAAPRSLSQAKAIAAKFAAQKGGSAKKVARRALTCARVSEADRPYYVFNQGDNQGFTIVSADDVLPEIVGYADTGAFDDGNMPEGLAAFMDAYRKTATAILAGEQGATDNLMELTAMRSARKATAVSPLLGSIAWAQSAPYNNLCPLYNGTERAVTGCVATAMAQVMAYYKYPATLQATIPSYTYKYNGNTITTEAIAKGEAYDWDNMLPRYLNGAYTEAQANAVAKLMYHCGAAVKMQYGPSSGAHLEPEVLASYFGYDADLMQLVYRKAVTLDKWTELLDNELEAGRPILYAGSSSSGGHQFVCDGRDENGLYHINWGWSGSDNGYFDINILNPGYDASFPAPDGYTWDADIIIGIAPDNGKADKPFVESPSSHVSQNSYSISWTKQTRGNESESFAGSVNITFANKTDTDFKGKVGLGIKDDNGNVKLISEPISASILKQPKDGYYISINDFSFDYAFPVGCTVLYGVYSYDGKTWHTCVPLYYMDWGKFDYLNLKASATEIKKTQRVDLTAGITADDEVIRNTTNNVGITLHNNLPEEYLGKISVYVSDTKQKPSSATSKYLMTVPGKGEATRTIRLSPTSEKLYVWVDDEAGDCILNGYELSTVTYAAPVLALTSEETNAVKGLYETENAQYTSGELVKAPRTNEDKATFRYEIRNTGGKTRRTFCFALKGLPDYPVKRIRKTVTLEANSVNYVTVETTPEEMGSRFMQCFMTMEDEKDKATLTYDVETQKLYCVSNNYRYILPTGVQAIYVGGKEATGIQQPTVDAPFASGTSAKVYDLKGNLVDGFATRESFGKLPQGIYIVNGKKLLKK